jgi:hypothetical protein
LLGEEGFAASDFEPEESFEVFSGFGLLSVELAELFSEEALEAPPEESFSAEESFEPSAAAMVSRWRLRVP